MTENPELRDVQHRSMIASIDLMLAELGHEKLCTLRDDSKALQSQFESRFGKASDDSQK